MTSVIIKDFATAAEVAGDIGLAAGERVVAALENSAEHAALVAASWHLGLQWIAVAPTASGPTFAGILESAAPRAVVIDAKNERLARVLAGWAQRVRPFGELTLGVAGESKARIEPRAGEWQSWLDQAPPAVFYTSGSTSTAKGVPLLWPRILQKARDVLGFYGVTRADRVMPILPLSHVYGLYWLMGALDLGAECVVCRESASPAALAAALADHAVTVAACPPMVGAFLFGRHGAEPAVREKLRVLTMGGAATAPEQSKRILAALPRTRVFLSYGLAETYSTISGNEASRPGADLSSVGPLRYGAFGEARDPASGLAVAPGETGELCVGGSIMTGYVGAHGDAFTADGLFRTGDLVRIERDGAITITGRIKEMINAGGLSIYPSEIEDVLKQHPAVADCGVFGEQAGALEVVCAAVVLREPASVDELLQHCRTELSAKMLPRRIVVVPAIPRGALGKIARAELRKLTAAAQAEAQSLPTAS